MEIYFRFGGKPGKLVVQNASSCKYHLSQWPVLGKKTPQVIRQQSLVKMDIMSKLTLKDIFKTSKAKKVPQKIKQVYF